MTTHSTRVSIFQHDESLLGIKSHGLTNERWQGFLRATEGAVYDKSSRYYVAPVEKVPSMLVRLRHVPLDVSVDDEAGKALHRQNTQQWYDVQMLERRIAALDAQIRESSSGSKYLFDYQRYGARWLAMRPGGALLADQPGLGKEQPCSEPVLTPSGWRTIGELKTGDRVYDEKGNTCTVLKTFPQGEKDVFRITLSDGTSTRCGLEHLWFVTTHNRKVSGRPGVVMSLREIVERGLQYNCKGSPQYKWYVPVAEPVKHDFRPVDLHPYLMGALIANGTTEHGGVMHSGLPPHRAQIEPLLPSGHSLSPVKGKGSAYDFSIVGGGPWRNVVIHALRRYGLFGKKSPVRGIHEDYLRGSVEQRKQLLAGLMDHDGTIAADGMHIEYNTTSPQLAADFLDLARSLGCLAWVRKRIPWFTYKGEKKRGLEDHRITLVAPFNPFRVPFKAERYRERKKYPPTRRIENVELVGREESVCILVDSPSHLYLTKDHIVTHNTLEVIAALPAGGSTIVVCPSGLKRNAWLPDLKEFRPQINVSILKGKESFRWPEPGELLLMNPEILPNPHDEAGTYSGRPCKGWLPPEMCRGCKEGKRLVNGQLSHGRIAGEHLKECLKRGKTKKPKRCPGCSPFLKHAPKGLILVCDEAQWLKGGTAERTHRFRCLRTAVFAKEGRVWLMSGTPLENDPSDMWSVLSAAGIAEEAYGSYDQFVQLWKGTKGDYGGYTWGTPESELPEMVRRLRVVMLRRLKSEVQKELPAKMWRDIRVDLSRSELEKCDRALQMFGGADALSTALEGGEELLKFERLAGARADLARAKIPALLGWIETAEEIGEPVVVFSAHKDPISALRNRKGWVFYTGDESENAKTKSKESFQAGIDEFGRKVLGIGCTIRAAGVGLTLTRAAKTLFVDRDWKSTANEQAEDRTHRIGQDRGVLYETLVANHPIDERVAEVNERKREMIRLGVDSAAVEGTDKGELSLDALKSATAETSAIYEQLRREQVAIAAGQADRTVADLPWKVDVLAGLGVRRFLGEADRMARDLMAEADAIGLSDEQWRIAERLVNQGALPSSKVDEQEDEMPDVVKAAAEALPAGEWNETGGSDDEPEGD